MSGVIFMILWLASSTIPTVPLSMVMNSPGIINPNAIDDGPDDDDDFTTHTLERLSSAATCLVAGVEYTHGQQIYRKDQCEFCLCLDGEMFCWWQDCPPAMEGPCKDRGPFSPCQNGVMPNAQPLESKATTKAPTTAPPPPASSTKSQSPETDVSVSTDFVEEASTEMTDYTSQETASGSSSSSTPAPKSCLVMGRKYNIGDRLPHDTGNCVECICGTGAQITCSPHQCGPPGDDINDYRPPGKSCPTLTSVYAKLSHDYFRKSTPIHPEEDEELSIRSDGQMEWTLSHPCTPEFVS